MTWLQRYRVRHYVANSIWILPSLSIAAAILAIRLLHWVEVANGWESDINPSAMQTVLASTAFAMFTLVVFVSSALLVVVQLASSQLTPRIIAVVFNNPVMKLSLAVFLFTFTFTLAAMARISTSVPPLTAQTAAYSSVVSLVVFLYLIDRVGKTLRPSGAVWAVAVLGREIIASVYPGRLGELPGPVSTSAAAPDGEPTRIIPNRKDGAVLAFDIPGLVSLAQRANCVIELVPQVGDFVAAGDPLFRLFQGGEGLSADALCQSIVVGQERTLEQDPAFRILVDIASKGRSPAINDPTTAVLALVQIHHLLRDVGRRHLDDDRVRDKASRLRLLYRTPDWADFVQLAVTEIRHFGWGVHAGPLLGA